MGVHIQENRGGDGMEKKIADLRLVIVDGKLRLPESTSAPKKEIKEILEKRKWK